MEDEPLLVFAARRGAPPLRVLWDALQSAGFPAGIGIEIAGEATDEELDDPHWDAAFARWNEPEMHEVWLIERSVVGKEERADALLSLALQRVANNADAAGRFLVTDHLRRTQALYSFQLLPALFTEDDHPAWNALDVALRCLAANTEGLIYAESEGFYDAEGEMLLEEANEGE